MIFKIQVQKRPTDLHSPLSEAELEGRDRFGALPRAAKDNLSLRSSIGDGGSDIRSPLRSAGSDPRSLVLSGSDLKSSRSGTKSFEIDCDTDTDVHLGYSQGYSTDQSSLPKRYRRSRWVGWIDRRDRWID